MTRLAFLPPLLLAGCLAGCLGGFTERYARGNAALSTDEGAVYLVVISPILQQALNHCIPEGTPGASRVIVLVADVNRDGYAEGIDVEPDSGGTACLEQQLYGRLLPKPPLRPGEDRFPVGLKIETK